MRYDMPVVKQITVSDETAELISEIRAGLEKKLLRPVTQTEVLQNAIEVGLHEIYIDPIRNFKGKSD